MKSMLILFLLGCMSSCSDQNKTGTNQITVAGKIDGLGGETITMISFEELKKAEIKDDGIFSITFYHDHEWNFSLRTSGHYFQFFLEPGDSIYISVDINDVNSTYRASGDKEKREEEPSTTL